LHCWKSTPPFLTPASVGSLFPPRFTWDIHDTQVALLKSSWIRTTPWGPPVGKEIPIDPLVGHHLGIVMRCFHCCCYNISIWNLDAHLIFESYLICI
jgi:hypothetical protein